MHVKRFRVFVLCSDKTGVLPLVFGDREIRRLTGKMVFDVELDLTEVGWIYLIENKCMCHYIINLHISYT